MDSLRVRLRKEVDPMNSSDPLKPAVSVLCKLGSIAIHVQEMLSAKGHHFDKLALESLMQDKELTDWLHDMDKLAMIPKAR